MISHLQRDTFKSSAWFDKDYKGNASHENFIIKMDHVYNYYSDLYNITTESEKSDCPDNIKSGGNCYNYTESYNNIFNNAIIKNPIY